MVQQTIRREVQVGVVQLDGPVVELAKHLLQVGHRIGDRQE